MSSAKYVMLITRTSSPAISIVDLTTLAQWLRIDTSTDTATVHLLLGSAQDYIEGVTGRVLSSANYTVAYEPSYCLDVPLFPLNTVTSVTATAADGTTTTLVAGTDYIVKLTSQRPSIQMINIPSGTALLTVTANAGYVSLDSIPVAIQHAAAVLVAASYDSRSLLDPATMMTVGNLVAKYRRVFL